MKLRAIKTHNFRSALDADIEAHDYMLLVGANNVGKSAILNTLRVFYDDAKWTAEDFPKTEAADNESWVQIKFQFDDDEWAGGPCRCVRRTRSPSRFSRRSRVGKLPPTSWQRFAPSFAGRLRSLYGPPGSVQQRYTHQFFTTSENYANLLSRNYFALF